MGMLSKSIIKTFHSFMELTLWLSLIGFIVAGYQIEGIGTALVGLLAWAIFAIVFCGTFLLIADIQKNVEKIASSKN